ncbi:MAG: phosphoenolpyruvate synthase [Firmicutes bacterium]|nr:phosphoenolpyruvate synthase [Bacillota bacterium]
MGSYVLGLREIDRTKIALAGGKGANLGELARLEGIQVPDGFCVTTKAYQEMTGNNGQLQGLIGQLSLLEIEDQAKISAVSGQIRELIVAIVIEAHIRQEIADYLAQLGEHGAYAVRSSATAEDLPAASFAGQQDTYLNITGQDSLYRHISKCWASLFTDRAVTYRMRNGFDQAHVHLAVVVQKMVFPEAAGIMFTADPITANRRVVSIDAGFGLGEALVAGLVTADNYKVRDGVIVDRQIAAKKLAVYAAKEGGTEERKLDAQRRSEQTLTDEQILRLARIGRTIESYFGQPQDIEWCRFAEQFFIVQSRPVTSLFPIPGVPDGKNHVYMSIGHQQMMTDAIKPLGLSFFLFLEELVLTAGGRLFMDFAHDLASPVGRLILKFTLAKMDPLMDSAVKTLMKRRDFVKSLARGKRYLRMGAGYFSWALLRQVIKIYRHNDPDLVAALIAWCDDYIDQLQQKIAPLSGEELFAFIETEYPKLTKALYEPRSMGMVMVGLYALNAVNKNMAKWLGKKSAADVLAQSLPNNITSAMGLELLDVADAARQYPAVLAYFEHADHADNDTFFADLARLEGGQAVSASIKAYLAKYGMRCAGEIDITRPRWHEQPTALVTMLLSNIKNFAPGARQAIFEQGLREAEQKRREFLDRLQQLPGGKQKARKAARMISILRNFIGYREYPKYFLVRCNWVIKQAMLHEAAQLVQKGVLQVKEDIYYLFFEELQEVVRTGRLDYGLIAKRKAEYQIYERLTPPRVMTSDGEVVFGAYDTANMPPGALAGIPVSAGVIEGRARVMLKMEDARVEQGDILVTTYTDPSWTPVFVSIKGLVTEVGGMMTHGAVVAREYGLPAVAGVENAVRLIKDGQKIRVNGTEGYVEIL